VAIKLVKSLPIHNDSKHGALGQQIASPCLLDVENQVFGLNTDGISGHLPSFFLPLRYNAQIKAFDRDTS
jgi:hypothetical protein